jgi:hypothetical protein
MRGKPSKKLNWGGFCYGVWVRGVLRKQADKE